MNANGVNPRLEKAYRDLMSAGRLIEDRPISIPPPVLIELEKRLTQDSALEDLIKQSMLPLELPTLADIDFSSLLTPLDLSSITVDLVVRNNTQSGEK